MMAMEKAAATATATATATAVAQDLLGGDGNAVATMVSARLER